MSTQVPDSRNMEKIVREYDLVNGFLVPWQMSEAMLSPSFVANSKTDYNPVGFASGGQLAGNSGGLWEPYLLGPLAKWNTLKESYNAFVPCPMGPVSAFPTSGAQEDPPDSVQAFDYNLLMVPRPNESAIGLHFWNGCQADEVNRMYNWNVAHRTDFMTGNHFGRFWHNQNPNANKVKRGSTSYIADGNAGYRIGNVFILEKNESRFLANETHTQYTNAGKIYMKPVGADAIEYPATIETMMDFIDQDPSQWQWTDTTVGYLSAGDVEYHANPQGANQITDWYMYAYSQWNGSRTEMQLIFNVPKKVRIQNITPFPMRIAFYVHDYRWWWYSPPRSDRFYIAGDCKHPNNDFTGDESEALVMANTKLDGSFFNFGTGLQEGWNEIVIQGFGYHDIDATNLVWKGCPGIDDNFCGWDHGVRYIGDGSKYTRMASPQKMNGGCYGFWIDWNEAFCMFNPSV